MSLQSVPPALHKQWKNGARNHEKAYFTYSYVISGLLLYRLNKSLHAAAGQADLI
mgnify:CR=1 FL=1